MALKVIATATDVLVMLGLMGGQVKKDNSNAMGYLLSYAIFAMNIMVIWK